MRLECYKATISRVYKTSLRVPHYCMPCISTFVREYFLAGNVVKRQWADLNAGPQTSLRHDSPGIVRCLTIQHTCLLGLSAIIKDRAAQYWTALQRSSCRSLAIQRRECRCKVIMSRCVATQVRNRFVVPASCSCCACKERPIRNWRMAGGSPEILYKSGISPTRKLRFFTTVFLQY